MRKFLVIGSLLLVIPAVIGFNLYYFFTAHSQNLPVGWNLFTRVENDVAYAALPNKGEVLGASIQEKDGRVENLQRFFTKYHSILSDYAQNMVTAADLYGIDYRLLGAIAMQESGGCQAIPVNSNNCWGFGIYGSQVRSFPDYPTAIDVVSKALAQHYVSHGHDTPENIMPVWDPASNGTWAKGVQYFMDQM